MKPTQGTENSFEGTLRFLQWDGPWMVGEVDIRPSVMSLADRLHDSRVSQDRAPDACSLSADKKSDSAFSSETWWMVLQNGFGGTNCLAALSCSLQSLNGRDVIASITDDGFKIFDPDPSKYHGVKYHGGNLARVCDGDETRVCEMCTDACCAFLAHTKDGFMCAKFDSYLCRQLLGRIADGSMNATRIGSCRLLGRED